MKYVTLQFNTLSDLVGYQMLAQKHGYKIVVTQFTLEGLFTEAEIALAISTHGAQVVREHQQHTEV